ncbi:DUF4139 domain-containing protein [Candidatus Poribacteria bacterium]|nr:DUF4139 domain-containing protein [Candidatus Poribacteria bacterium]
MTNRRFCKITLFCFLFVTLCIGTVFTGWARVGLMTLPVREDIKIKIDRNMSALIQETRTIAVKQGRNTIEFNWPNMQIDFNTVQIQSLADAKMGIKVLSMSVPPASQSSLLWEVESAQAGEMPMKLIYLTSGLGWICHYIALVEETEDRLSLEAAIEVSNRTVEEYKDTVIKVDVIQPMTKSLKAGESKKITFLTVANVPIEKGYISDPNLFGDAVAMQYIFKNDEKSGLGAGMLLQGKVRIYKKDAASGGVGFIGEDVLPYVPNGGEIRLYAGTSRDIEVERKVMSSKRVNVRRDKKGRTVVYDTEESYRMTVKNHKDVQVKVTLKAYLNDYWQMSQSDHNYEKKDARTIEYVVPVPANAEEIINFQVSGKNISQGYVIQK